MILVKLIYSNVAMRWPCHVCNSHEKQHVHAESDDGFGVCTGCLKTRRFDENEIKAPTIAEWERADELIFEAVSGLRPLPIKPGTDEIDLDQPTLVNPEDARDPRRANITGNSPLVSLVNDWEDEYLASLDAKKGNGNGKRKARK